MLLRAALIASLAFVSVPVVSISSTALADGVERPRIERKAPRPRARPAPRPAPRAQIAPPPQIIERVIIQDSRDITLSDGFFSGPLTGGVGFGMDAGSGLGGGGVVIQTGAARSMSVMHSTVKIGSDRAIAGRCG